MNEKKIAKLTKKIEVLENMIEDSTRSLFLSKEEVERYANFADSVMNSMRDILIVINEQGVIEFTNEMGLQKMGIKKTDIGSKTIRDLLGDKTVNEIIEAENDGETQLEVCINFEKGKEIPALVSRIPYIRPDSSENGFVYSIVDLNMLKEKEKIIEQQRALLVQNTQLASLGEMASGIAHEINNPVTIMEGQLRRLKDYLSDEEISHDQKVELTKKIQGNLNRVVDIVAGIRKISRTGESDQLMSLNISTIYKGLQNLCSEKLKNQCLTLDFESEENLPNFQGKETQVLQILFNLVSNSSDAIEKLKEKWIKILATSQEDLVFIRVLDSGTGIDKSIVDKLFNPFFTTKDIGKGTGIGLGISKQMASEMNGELHYELWNGNTSFVLSLKADKQ